MNDTLKLTVLYGHPADPAAFEAHYQHKHLPLAAATPGLGRTEATLCVTGPDGAAPAFYRLFEAWFDGPEHLTRVSQSPAWQLVVADLPNFASGGVTVLLSRPG
jgi:uncharacterized protein (TIGR02118 family)